MGKNGKSRKRQRNEKQSDIFFDLNADAFDEEIEKNIGVSISVLNALSHRLDLFGDKKLKKLRISLFPLIQRQMSKYFEPTYCRHDQLNDAEFIKFVSPENILTTVKIANYFCENYDLFDSATYKPFRKALHPLVLFQKSDKIEDKKVETLNELGSLKLSNKVSTFFRNHNWLETLIKLYEMSLNLDEIPKLGTLQRWVRDCDVINIKNNTKISNSMINLNNTEDSCLNTYLLLLHAVLQLIHIKKGCDNTNIEQSNNQSVDFRIQKLANKMKTLSHKELLEVKAVLSIQPLFSVGPVIQRPYHSISEISHLLPIDFKQRVSVVSHVPGCDRRPPSKQDLNVYSFSSNSIPLPALATRAHRHDVPNVPGAFIMTGVLSQVECGQFIAAAEAIGFVPDAVDGIDNLVLYSDPSILDSIYDRCLHMLPQTLNNRTLAGINARFRLFRYYPGAEYRPHIDGSWPGSGLVDGQFTDDAFGDRSSQLTFLIYLNDGFTGGTTTFFLPGSPGPAEGPETVAAWPVEPRVGSVLCFPHGNAAGALVHEGSRLESAGPLGGKYVMRTDVLYLHAEVEAHHAAAHSN